MKVVTRVFLYDENEKVFGQGPYELLNHIQKTGSLKAAANEMGLSYSKALKMMNIAQKGLPFELTKKTVGGKGGGGSVLTDEAIVFLEKYKAFKEACDEANRKLYSEYFSEL